jgi:hypothetical protein
MITFQLTLTGYKPDTSETDHLIKWVNAPTSDTLSSYLDKRPSVRLQELPLVINTRGLDDGVDIVLSITGRPMLPVARQRRDSAGHTQRCSKTHLTRRRSNLTLCGATIPVDDFATRPSWGISGVCRRCEVMAINA